MSPNNVAYFYSLVFSDKTMKEIGLIDEKVKICVMEVARNSAAVVRPVKDLAYDVVEVMPEYPGGSEALSKYLSESIKYPEEAYKNGIQGRVIVTFVINKDGSISDAKVVKSVDPQLDEEALRVVHSMPNWIPGRQNGEPVNVKYTVPITFKLQGNESKEVVGVTSLNAKAFDLEVDGKLMDAEALNSINPDDIESIHVDKPKDGQTKGRVSVKLKGKK